MDLLGCEIRTVHCAMLAREISSLAALWTAGVTRSDVSDIVRIDMVAGGRAASVRADWIGVDVIHWGAGEFCLEWRYGVDSLNGPP